MKKLIIPIFLLIGISINVFAEEKSNKELKGDKYYRIYSFDKAIDKYSHAKQLSVEGQRRLAQSYHNINQNVESEATYMKFIANKTDVVAEDYFSYAMVLKNNGKYDLANISLEKFKELKPNDLRAKDYAAHNRDLNNLLKDDGKYKITHLDINTDAEDFGTSFFKDKIVFASSRATPKWIKRIDNWTRKPYLDMYMAKVESGQLKNPEVFDKHLNSKMHDGTASFNKEGTFIAFTSNNYNAKRKDHFVKLEIYFSNYKDEKWEKPVAFQLNNKEYSVGHPCLTADGNTMYFTSDMPGGFGGADIYRTTKDAAGNWGKAENLGDKINTEGDEMFPYFKENKEVLYFASNGRFGLGGLDVFIAPIEGIGFGDARNAGYPLNTQYDDFAVIVENKSNQGYFSSNRADGSGSDDIYALDILKVVEVTKKIEGFAIDNIGKHVPAAVITLYDDKGNTINTIKTKDDGAYSFLVEPNKNFKLIGQKDNYIDGNNIANTFGNELIVKADVELLKKEEIIARKIVVGADLGKILEFNPDRIYFDYNKFAIRPDAEIDLAKVVKIMNDYPNMVVELGSYTDCRAAKGYNQILSDKRAKASAEYVKKRITKPERIYGKGYGESKLVNRCACEGKVISDCSREEHQKNRRTEFIIVKK